MATLECIWNEKGSKVNNKSWTCKGKKYVVVRNGKVR